MYKLCCVLLFVTSTLAFPQKKDSLDDLILDIFGPDATTKGSTIKSPNSTGKEINVEEEIEKIFGSDSKKTTASPSSTENLDDAIDKIFGSDDNDRDAKKPTPPTSVSQDKLAETAEKCYVNDTPGICVKYYLCEMPITNEGGLIDIANQEGINCNHYLDACCSKDRILADAPTA